MSWRWCCKKNKSEESIKELMRLPLLRLIKEPVNSVSELYVRYPNGGEYGWFAFVYDDATFYYWDVNRHEWLPMHSKCCDEQPGPGPEPDRTPRWVDVGETGCSISATEYIAPDPPGPDTNPDWQSTGHTGCSISATEYIAPDPPGPDTNPDWQSTGHTGCSISATEYIAPDPHGPDTNPDWQD